MGTHASREQHELLCGVLVVKRYMPDRLCQQLNLTAERITAGLCPCINRQLQINNKGAVQSAVN